ncbi:MAG: hypothetical protein HY549_02615 [Elusimicrobia bacterium]|nr:hypothetical protein [Elusimicrobiota bacterium]
MQETMRAIKANIDYPREYERITSHHYTFRVKAPLNAEKVEVCVDGSPWQLCRYSAGYWWFDWSNYTSGEHEIVARILPFDSQNYVIRSRRFEVDLENCKSAGAPMVMQYSVMTSNDPWTVSKITDLLSKEDVVMHGMMMVTMGDQSTLQFMAPRCDGLREKLENEGLSVVEKEVFHLEIPNHPEELHRLVRSLAENGIHIRSLYGSVEGKNARVALAVDKPENAAPLVSRFSVN